MPTYDSEADVYSSLADGTPGLLKQAGVKATFYSAFGSAIRAEVLVSLTYTHVVLLPPDTAVVDDATKHWDPPAFPPPADWIAPGGLAPVLKVVFAERRKRDTADDHLRLYCMSKFEPTGTHTV